jgi:hypothetical protein
VQEHEPVGWELVGLFSNGGQEWRAKGEPEEAKVHDFMDKKLGKAIPYGVYDRSENEGWVSVGIDHDTARCAVQAIARWWQQMGARRYPHAQELLIMADGGGSNGSSCRLWKVALQELVSRLGIPLPREPFPAGHQQVEQNRTSYVLPHHAELSRPTAGESRNHCQLDCCREHTNWLASR